ncbi:MAG: quinone-dependent dihydroorotate dehydrogenase [Acidobacteriota bacterium]
MSPIYRRCLRPLLFRLDPESVHHGVGGVCRVISSVAPVAALMRRWSEVRSDRLVSDLLGARFPNPLGMAAGFDKTGALYPFLSIAGFGFVESGTFTRLAQSGNPKPRLFRFAAEEALVNRMGFNNPGASVAAARFVGLRKTVPLGISVGKTRVAALEDAAADQAETIALLARFGDYVAVNVSSPNTPGLRDLQEESRLREVIAAAREGQRRGGAGGQPLLVKLAPDFEDADFDRAVCTAAESAVDGFILTNTTLRRDGVPSARHIEGGLSGPALRQRSTELIRRAFRLVEGKLPIIGVGGIGSGEHALDKIRAGASLVQLYTAYVFAGPSLPREINRSIDAECRRLGCTVGELVGSENGR